MPGLLRSVWDEPRPPHTPPRMWWDWTLVAVLVPLAVLETALRPDLPGRFLAGAVAVALTPTLLWRRTRPLLMVAIAFGTCAVASLVIGADLKPSVLAYLREWFIRRSRRPGRRSAAAHRDGLGQLVERAEGAGL